MSFLRNPKVKRNLLIGSILLFFGYQIFSILVYGTLEQGKIDWGVDQGSTQIFWGIVLVTICTFFLVYPNQQFFRNIFLSKSTKIIFSSVLFFLLIGMFLLQWIFHWKEVDFYHLIDISTADKVGHVIVTFILVIFCVAILRSWIGFHASVIFAIMVMTLFELFEILFMFHAGAETSWLLGEIGDVVFDILFNLIGVVLALLVLKRFNLDKR